MADATQLEPAEGTGGAWFLNHLPTILWQRRLYIILPFIVVTAAAVIGAYTLPTIYRSTATLLVVSPDLPSDIAQSLGTNVEDRIAQIREQVLSRGDLISLIEQNNLYARERRSKPMSVVVDKMRESTLVGSLSGGIGKNSTAKKNVIAVSLSFDYPEPAKAQAVLQGYVTQFLQKDNEQTQDQADAAVHFLEDQEAKLGSQVNEIESRITAIKEQNGAALAGGSAPMLMDTGSYTSQIASLESQNRELLARSQVTSVDPELAAAEAALAKALATYSDNHPDVVQARARVQELKRAVPSSEGNAAVHQQIQANNAAIAQLRAARDRSVATANAAFASQTRAPAILEQVSQLQSQASTLREQYREVSTNLLKARGSARLVSEQRGERLSLVEPASLPDEPLSPNRPLLIAAGALGGLIFGFLLALGVELLKRPMRSPSQVEALGLPVLGLVPIFDADERKRGLAFFRRRETRLG